MHAFHRGLGARGFFAFFVGKGHGFAAFRLRYALVAGRGVVVQIVHADARNFVVRVFQMRIGNQEHRHVQPFFHAEQLGAFFVEQESRHINRHLRVHFACVFFHRRVLNQAQNVQRGGFDAANHARARAARASDVAGFCQRRLQALARQFQQAEFGQFAHLHARAVAFERVFQRVFHFALVLGVFHVNEVNHHQAAQVAQAHLAGDFFRRFHIGAERGFLDVCAARGAGGVYINRNKGFGVVNHNRAAAGQRYFAREHGFNLLLNLQARKQRNMVVIQFQPA